MDGSEFFQRLGNLVGSFESLADRKIESTRRLALIKIDQMNREFSMRALSPAENGITTENWKDELKKHETTVNEYIGTLYGPARSYIKSDISNMETNLALALTANMTKRMHEEILSEGIVAREQIKNGSYSPEERFQRLSKQNDEFEASGIFAPKTIADWRSEDMRDARLAAVQAEELEKAGGDLSTAAKSILGRGDLTPAEASTMSQQMTARYSMQAAQALQPVQALLSDSQTRWTEDLVESNSEYIESLPLSESDKEQAQQTIFQAGYNDFLEGINRELNHAGWDPDRLGTLEQRVLLDSDYWESPSGETDRKQILEDIHRRMATPPGDKSRRTNELKAGIAQIEMGVTDPTNPHANNARGALRAMEAIAHGALNEGIYLYDDVREAKYRMFKTSPSVQNALDNLAPLLRSSFGAKTDKDLSIKQRKAFDWTNQQINDYIFEGNHSDTEKIDFIHKSTELWGAKELGFMRDRQMSQGERIKAVGTLNAGELDAGINLVEGKMSYAPGSLEGNVNQAAAYQVEQAQKWWGLKGYKLRSNIAEDGSVTLSAKKPDGKERRFRWNAAKDGKSMVLEELVENWHSRETEWQKTGHTVYEAARLPKSDKQAQVVALRSNLEPEAFADAAAELIKKGDITRADVLSAPIPPKYIDAFRKKVP